MALSVALAVTFSAVLSTAVQAGAPLPLTGDLKAHDPSLLREGQRQWVFTTGIGLPRLSSADGVHWVREAPVFAPGRTPAWWLTIQGPGDADAWAPKAFHHRGRVYLLYALSRFGSQRSAIALASADRADSADWVDHGILVESQPGERHNAIDADLLRDGEGRLWLAWGSWWGGLVVQPLDAQTLKPSGVRTAIARRGGGIEAPTLLQRGGWTYLFMSTGLCCKGVDSTYEVRVGRSREVRGPYLDREGRPLLEGGGTLLIGADARWKGPGHQDVVGDDIVWHAYDATAGGQPTLRRAVLDWDADGWPRL